MGKRDIESSLRHSKSVYIGRHVMARRSALQCPVQMPILPDTPLLARVLNSMRSLIDSDANECDR